jgi:hypothetical protein
MYDVGIGKVVEMALDAVNPDRNRPIHLSFDVDACDPSVAPSTGTPVGYIFHILTIACSSTDSHLQKVRGGLTFREAHYIVEAIAETDLLVSFDIMEVNPTLGTNPQAVEQTVNIGRSLVRSALGEQTQYFTLLRNYWLNAGRDHYSFQAKPCSDPSPLFITLASCASAHTHTYVSQTAYNRLLHNNVHAKHRPQLYTLPIVYDFLHGLQR